MNPDDIKTVAQPDQFLPDAVLVTTDHDVLAILCSIGYLPSELECDPGWVNSDYSTLFVLLDESGADYSHVWGLSWGTIPHLDRPVDLIWKNHKLLV
jgi:hypothetical protein